MRADIIDALVDAVKPLAVRWVVLSGGEAMQHPEWAAIARRFREQGARALLLTNGLLMRKQIDDVIASVDEVIVSLDGGTAETYHAIRGVDGFDLILDGIRHVRAADIPVTTRTTVQRANFREIPAIIDVCKRADVNHISFLTVDVSNPVAFGDRFMPDASIPMIGSTSMPEHHPPMTALTRDDVHELSAILDHVEREYAADFVSGRIAEAPAKLRKMLTYFAALNGETPFPAIRCNAPQLSAVVEVDGSMRPCYFLPTMGSVSGHGAAGGLNTSQARELRAEVRAGSRPECERCVCPLYKGARALLEM
jgi:MoaA/NifB/PqqE/SkfB family radical SAM enzyme